MIYWKWIKRVGLGLIAAGVIYGIWWCFQPPDPPASLKKVAGCDEPDCQVDVVFIHGVDGDAFSTWTQAGNPEAFWPKWLSEKNPQFGVWTFGYPAASTFLSGPSMGLIARADNLLTLLEAEGFDQNSERPLVFVTHSFGGLVVKQMLRTAAESKEPAWQKIRQRTKGVVFISTPHQGAGFATFLNHIAGAVTNQQVHDLERATDVLLSLGSWYRDHSTDLGVTSLSFCETQRTKGVVVVDKASGDPNITGCRVRPLDANHITICKLTSPEEPLFKHTSRFISDLLKKRPLPPPPPADLPQVDGGCGGPPAGLDNEPVIPAEEVVLLYQNVSGESVTLVLFDWSRHKNKMNGVTRFLDTSSSKELRSFENFLDDSTGWFSIYLLLPDGNYSKCLGTTNLFSTQKPKIIIKREANEYVAEIE